MLIKLLLISYFLCNTILFSQSCFSNLNIISSKPALVKIDSLTFIGDNVNIKVFMGKHFIKLQEYRKWNSKIIFDSITINDCNMNLLKEFSFLEKKHSSSLLQTSNQNISFGKSEQRFHETNLFKALLGSAIVFGTTAAYFKLKADKKYDEFILYKNNELRKQVDRYDLISGISFGLLQINFGYLLYKFLTD